MKKYLKMLVALIIVFSLSGCVKYDMSMKINSDKSMDFEFIYASLGSSDVEEDEEQEFYFGDEDATEGEVEKQIVIEGEDSLEQAPLAAPNEEDEQILTLEDNGEDLVEEEDNGALEIPEVRVEDYEYLTGKNYKVEEYKSEESDGTYVGVKITRKFDDIDKVTKNSKKVIDFTNFFEDSEKFDDSQMFSKDGENYVANFVFDFSEDMDEESIKQYASYFKLSYVVTLPEKPVSHNATKVSEDGKTLTWTLDFGKKNEVNYTFNFKGESAIPWLLIGCIGGGVLLLIIIIIVIVCVSKKGKKNDNIVANNEAPVVDAVPTVAPVTPVEPVAPVTTPNVEATVEPVQHVSEPANENVEVIPDIPGITEAIPVNIDDAAITDEVLDDFRETVEIEEGTSRDEVLEKFKAAVALKAKVGNEAPTDEILLAFKKAVALKNAKSRDEILEKFLEATKAYRK